MKGRVPKKKLTSKKIQKSSTTKTTKTLNTGVRRPPRGRLLHGRRHQGGDREGRPDGQGDRWQVEERGKVFFFFIYKKWSREKKRGERQKERQKRKEVGGGGSLSLSPHRPALNFPASTCARDGLSGGGQGGRKRERERERDRGVTFISSAPPLLARERETGKRDNIETGRYFLFFSFRSPTYKAHTHTHTHRKDPSPPPIYLC